MKNNMLLIIVFLSTLLIGQNQNILSIVSQGINDGTDNVFIAINLENEELINGIQFDIDIPANITLIDVTPGTDLPIDFSISWNYINNTIIRILTFSFSGVSIPTGNNHVFNLEIDGLANEPIGGIYLYSNGCVLSDNFGIQTNCTLEYGEIAIIETEIIDNYNWPIASITSPHRLSSVVNEYRTTDRIHQGVDIAGPDGTNVYAISSGKIIEHGLVGTENEYLLVYNTISSTAYKYQHIRNVNSLNDDPNEWIYESGTNRIIAYLNTENHLHFEDYTQFGNPVDNHTNSYFAYNPLKTNGFNVQWTGDTMQPEIKNSDSDLIVLTDGTSPTRISKDGIYGAVDFVIMAKDSIPNGNYGSNRGGLAKIECSITSLNYLNIVDLNTDKVYKHQNGTGINFIPYLYCISDCDSLFTDPYTQDGFVRYFITNSISNPLGPFSGNFNSNNYLDGEYELIVKVWDFNGNFDQVSWEITIDQSLDINY